MWVVGCGLWGVRLRVQGSGFKVQGSGFGVSRLRVWDLEGASMLIVGSATVLGRTDSDTS